MSEPRDDVDVVLHVEINMGSGYELPLPSSLDPEYWREDLSVWFNDYVSPLPDPVELTRVEFRKNKV